MIGALTEQEVARFMVGRRVHGELKQRESHDGAGGTDPNRPSRKRRERDAQQKTQAKIESGEGTAWPGLAG